jgi:hypothetical protein
MNFLELYGAYGERADTEEGSDVPNPIEEFFKTAELAASYPVGGFQHAHNLAVETAERDATVAALYKKIAADAQKKSAGAPPAGTSLEKAFGPGARRKESLRQYLKSQLAVGVSAQSVVDYARAHDEHTASLLLEIASEMGVA